jgi:hypothetical protein
MSIDQRTPAEREADAERARAATEEFRADLNELRADSEERRADVNAARANVFAASNAQNSVAAEQARREADFASTRAAVAERDANTSAFGFWLLAGLILVGLVLGILWYSNQPASQTPTSTTVIRNERVVVPAPAATPAVVERVVPVPIDRPVPVPVDRPVPVERPVPVPVPQNESVPAPAETAPAETAPAETAPTSVEPVPAPAGGETVPPGPTS